MAEGKREDLTTFNAQCPIFEANGKCFAGWKCRFAGSHSQEITREDGRKELVLIEDKERIAANGLKPEDDTPKSIVNIVSTQVKIDLSKRKTPTEKADAYNAWLEEDGKTTAKQFNSKRVEDTEMVDERTADHDNRAQYTEPPFLPSEKRKLYFGAETPVLAPLTTTGNLPFRRLCVELGAQLTYSEMAMAFPIMQGAKSEWALLKAHESEILPPKFSSKGQVVQGYDNSKDLRFGAQISSNKPWHALKAAEIMSKFVPNLRVIDLNCGCPIDMVYQSGGGSALLDAPGKLEKMIRGMNAVSGEIPITAKIRMGTRDNKPTATRTIERLAFGGVGSHDRLGAPVRLFCSSSDEVLLSGSESYRSAVNEIYSIYFFSAYSVLVYLIRSYHISPLLINC